MNLSNFYQMRKIDKSKVKIPNALNSVNCLNRIDDSITNIGSHKYSSNYYAHPSVHQQLEKLYNGKCAFCESDVRAGSSLQIDHYRPKEKVAEDNTHHGYYWLGYEWTNLIPICSKCNRSKWHYFPINSPTGKRIYNHPTNSDGSINRVRFGINDPDLLNEQPLIINPEKVDPNLFFTFLPSGKIKGRGQIESDVTIKICKLNRTELLITRKKIRDNILKKITRSLASLHSGDINNSALKYIVKSELIELLDVFTSNGPYSLYCVTLIKHFDYFIARRFQRADKRLIMEAYNEFISVSKSKIH